MYVLAKGCCVALELQVLQRVSLLWHCARFASTSTQGLIYCAAHCTWPCSKHRAAVQDKAGLTSSCVCAGMPSLAERIATERQGLATQCRDAFSATCQIWLDNCQAFLLVRAGLLLTSPSSICCCCCPHCHVNRERVAVLGGKAWQARG